MEMGGRKLEINIQNEMCTKICKNTPPLQKAKSQKFKVNSGSIKERHLL